MNFNDNSTSILSEPYNKSHDYQFEEYRISYVLFWLTIRPKYPTNTEYSTLSFSKAAEN